MNSSNTNTSIDLDTLKDTTTYFNNFYLPELSVSQNVDDSIIGYFEKVTDSKQAAKALAGAVILTSISQGLNPMEVLSKFAAMPANQLNDYLTMFLNLNRIGTSYLGINNAPKTSKYVERLIRA
jgi:hypothetical protein